MINRRDAIQKVALLMGGTLSIPSLAASLENFEFSGKSAFNPDQLKLVTEIADTIIPRTKTPGAKDAKVQNFVSAVVTDCYSPADRTKFIAGLVEVDKEGMAQFKKDFVKCTPAQRIAVLKKVEQAGMEHRKTGNGNHFWFMMKELTLTGYFTSEPGATQALEYVHTPGRYEGCVPLKPGQKAWAT